MLGTMAIMVQFSVMLLILFTLNRLTGAPYYLLVISTDLDHLLVPYTA